jgi:hypothetical protein
LPEEVEEQIENTGRNVGIRRVLKQRQRGRTIVKKQVCEWKTAYSYVKCHNL